MADDNTGLVRIDRYAIFLLSVSRCPSKEHMELETGDVVYFDAGVPHVCRALGKGPSRILAVAAAPDYPLHGNIAVLLEDR